MNFSKHCLVSQKAMGIRFSSTNTRLIGLDPFLWDADVHWKDMFGIDKLLTDDERLIR